MDQPELICVWIPIFGNFFNDYLKKIIFKVDIYTLWTKIRSFHPSHFSPITLKDFTSFRPSTMGSLIDFRQNNLGCLSKWSFLRMTRTTDLSSLNFPNDFEIEDSPCQRSGYSSVFFFLREGYSSVDHTFKAHDCFTCSRILELWNPRAQAELMTWPWSFLKPAPAPK